MREGGNYEITYAEGDPCERGRRTVTGTVRSIDDDPWSGLVIVETVEGRRCLRWSSILVATPCEARRAGSPVPWRLWVNGDS